MILPFEEFLKKFQLYYQNLCVNLFLYFLDFGIESVMIEFKVDKFTLLIWLLI
jgi:hypothetical protein